MSSKKWPNGTLRAALLVAHAEHPAATGPELARIVGCDRASARSALRALGLSVPKSKERQLLWTPDMKEALLTAALSNATVMAAAKRIGVAEGALVHGAFEIIRELAA